MCMLESSRHPPTTPFSFVLHFVSNKLSIHIYSHVHMDINTWACLEHRPGVDLVLKALERRQNHAGQPYSCGGTRVVLDAVLVSWGVLDERSRRAGQRQGGVQCRVRRR